MSKFVEGQIVHPNNAMIHYPYVYLGESTEFYFVQTLQLWELDTFDDGVTHFGKDEGIYTVEEYNKWREEDEERERLAKIARHKTAIARLKRG